MKNMRSLDPMEVFENKGLSGCSKHQTSIGQFTGLGFMSIGFSKSVSPNEYLSRSVCVGPNCSKRLSYCSISDSNKSQSILTSRGTKFFVCISLYFSSDSLSLDKEQSRKYCHSGQFDSLS